MHLRPFGKAIARLTIRSCIFEDSYAEELGGGFYSTWLDNMVIVECAFIGNGAMKWAGGFFVYEGGVEVTRS